MSTGVEATRPQACMSWWMPVCILWGGTDVSVTEKRVSNIEEDLKEIAHAQRRNEIFLEGFTREMKDFKDEMKDFKGEMLEFKNGVEEFKREARADRREMNRKWGDLANKMGTVVEDIIMPGFPGILRTYFQADPATIMPRVRRRHPRDGSRMREFDIIAVDETRLFLNETKSYPKMEYVRRFVDNYTDVLDFFPEYADRRIVPIFSSLDLPDAVVDYLSAHACYAVAMGEEHLDVLNFEEVERKRR